MKNVLKSLIGFLPQSCRALFSDCVPFPDLVGLISCVNNCAHSRFLIFLFRLCQLLLLTSLAQFTQMIQRDILH